QSLFGVDDFACPASFPWHTVKHVIRDPAPAAADFNTQERREWVLSAIRLWMRKHMDLFTFIHAPDPTKVRVVEREQDVDEPRLLDSTVGRTVSLLLVVLDRVDSELEASVERLFDEGDSVNRTGEGNYARGGPDVDIQPVVEMLLAGAVLNAKVGVTAIPTLPFVTAYVYTTPEREDEDHTDCVVEPNLRTIGAMQRFVIFSDSYNHSYPTIAEAVVDYLVMSSTPVMKTATTVTSTVDYTLVAKEKHVKPSLFVADSSSAGGADPNTSVFSDLTSNDFLVGGIRTVIDPDTNLQKVYVPLW
nr:hypothetical protein [Tanacetum cinerariifolium]